MSKHVIKGVTKFISNLLDLEFLSVDLILNVINSLVKLGDVHLSILKSSLSNLVLVLDAQDLLLQFLLSLNSLLSGQLKLLHVLTNHLQFLLNALELVLSQLCSLNGSLQFFLLDSELSGQFIKLLLIVTGHLCSLPQVLVKLFNCDLVVHTLALNNLDLLEHLISLLGGESKFGDSIGKVDLSLLGLLLHQHNSTA